MALYSYKNQYPKPLPNRIRLPNGFTRTDVSTFTEEEIISAGYAGPYTYPSHDPTTEKIEWVGVGFTVRPHNDQEIENQWTAIRNQRDNLLKESDYTQVSDYNFEITNAEEWKSYRQELRDITLQSNPFDITWPIMSYNQPEEVIDIGDGSGTSVEEVIDIADGSGTSVN